MFLWPLESENRYLHTYTHPSTVNTKRTVVGIRRGTDRRTIIRRTYRGWRYCLPETRTPIFSRFVPLMFEYIPRRHVVISPGVQLGSLRGVERKGLIQDGGPVGNRR